MKLSLPTFKKSSGFTLIELLVVIAIIGILAAALIATIDPLEQIRKANDTTRKNTAVEYVGSIARYYGTKQAFPWATVALGGAGCNAATAPADVLLSNLTSCTQAMVDESELKSAFIDTAAGLIGKDIHVGYDATTQRLVACFDPKSKSGDLDPTAKYTNAADAFDGVGACTPAANATCVWCAQ